MTRAMNTLILTRANFRRRYGNDAPEMSIPSRFLEEVPNALVENLGISRAPAWAYGGSSYGSGYGARRGNRRSSGDDEYEGRHYNYEDESQETPSSSHNSPGNGKRTTAASKPFTASWMTAKPGSPPPAASAKKQDPQQPEPASIDNIARFFGGKAGPGAPQVSKLKPGSLARPAMDIPAATGATGLKKGDRVRHSKYGEGSVLMREGEGEDAKLTVMFTRHGMKKLMEKFANLEKI
jgi:DNA helicase-2/ATP-dependent DNA helicase PcrA